jgi:large repetitive protein
MEGFTMNLTAKRTNGMWSKRAVIAFSYLIAMVLMLRIDPAAADINVNGIGQGGRASYMVQGDAGFFDLDMPLNKNAVNKVTITAVDAWGNAASKEVSITQVSLDSVVVSRVTSERLSIEQVEKLVADGVINLQDPQNYNVSTFDIVLTVGKQSAPVSVPIVTPKNQSDPVGFETYTIPTGEGGGGGAPKTQPEMQIVIFEKTIPGPPGQPAPPPIPGVIIIEGRIKSLKEFFTVRLLLMNTSGIFTLSDILASVKFPDSGLSNVLPADGIVSFGSILPGDGAQPGQVEKEFIIRGDAIGIHRVQVDFGGNLRGPGIPENEPIPFNGSAFTEVEVKGPPSFTVQVTHPDEVVAHEPYELNVNITNTGELPAMYASLELDVGADARMVKCAVDEQSGEPHCDVLEGPDVRALGHIRPGETVSAVFTIEPLVSGIITSCLGMADQNISLQVLVGSIGCLTGRISPQKGVPEGIPTVNVLPVHNAFGVGIDSPVTGFFSELMNESSITTGAGGSFNVFDSLEQTVPGTLRFTTINDKTVAIWQVRDNVSNRLEPDSEYTVHLTTAAVDLEGNALFNESISKFTTTNRGLNDTTPPTLTLSVEPPVNPNWVLPGQIVKINAYASDQGSGVVRVELRMKDLSASGSLYELVDQKSVHQGDQPPYIFSIDSAKLILGHTYQFMGTAYDYVGNSRNATVAMIIATSAAAPTIRLPDDPADPVLQGISVPVTPLELTGGVYEVRFYLDDSPTPFKTVNLAPYQASLGTLQLALGGHTVRALAEDGLHQTGEDTFAFTLAENKNMPVVSFPGSVDGSVYVTGSLVPVRGNAADPVGISSASFYLDAPAGTPLSTGLQPFLLATTELSPGDHRVYLLATNALGISNDPNDPASYLEFSVAELPSGPPPPPPSVSSISPLANGEAKVCGTTVAGGRVDLTNISLAISTRVYADANGSFCATLAGDPGHVFSIVVYDFSKSQQPSSAVTVSVPSPSVLDHIEAIPTTMTFTAANQLQDISVTGYYQGGGTADLTQKAAYSSSNPTAASVNAAGRVVALNSGTATITAAVGTLQAQVAVTVNIVVLTHITVDPATIALNSIGQTQPLAVTAHYSNGITVIAPSGISYVSGNPGTATVNGSGVVTAVANGNTEISVYLPGTAAVSVPVAVDTGTDTAPTVTILSPSHGADVERGELVAVSVKAEDAIGGVVRLYFEVTGQTTYATTRQIAPPAAATTQQFSFQVSNTADVGGIITVRTRAEDTSGKSSQVAVISLDVVDHTAPTVTITAPAQQTPFNYGDTVTITVNATDAVGVTQIHYQTTGALSRSGSHDVLPVAGSAGATFSFVFPYGVPDPDVQIQAFARDAAGNEGTAIPVHIILTDADIAPPETVVTAVADPGTGASALVAYQVTNGLEDLDHVELYFRRNTIGTFNRYTDATGGNAEGRYQPQIGNQGSISFDSTRMGGDGNYEFYTVGVDKAGNRETPPNDGGGNVVPDRTAQFHAGTVWTVISTSTVIGEGDTTYDNTNVRIVGAAVTLSGNHSFRNVELLQGARLTHPQTDLNREYGISLTAWTVTVDQTSAISVDARGYLGGQVAGNDCSGQTSGNVDGSTYRSGGSYGGLGGAQEGVPNGLYGNLVNPADLGSGGSCGYYSYAGGNGGGRILVQAVNVVCDGAISANGGTGAGYSAGSGSGGTVYFASSTISGKGAIQADGGAHEVGGGGGRVALHFVDIATLNTNHVHALAGQGSARQGGNGTVFLKGLAETNGTLVVDGQGTASAFTNLPIPPGYTFDHVIMRNSARVVVDGLLKVNGTVALQSSSVLTHSLGSEAGLVIEAQRVEVDATSSIDVSSKGYRGGKRDGNSRCEGVTLGGFAGAFYRSGGSYGGYGGVLEGVGSNLPYGSVYDPVYLGSGGSCGYYSYAGGHGGGFVHIKATQALVVDGNLLANGGSGSGYQAGSGSGGSIKIETSLLQGTGAIAANGGAYEVGGGGGRVAVTYDYLDPGGDDFSGLRNITALGGHGNHSWGSAGTMLLRRSDQQQGDLYVDDGVAGATSSVYTPLTTIGFGTVAAVTEDTLETDGTMNLPLNGLVGLELNPNLNQTVTYRVLSNTETVITVDTSGKPLVSAVTSAGARYAGIYRFDNVRFRRGGFLVLGDRLIVSDTMNIDEYGRLTHYDATMGFTSMLDVTVGRLEITATGSIDTNARGYLGGNRNGNDCSGQTEGNANGSTYRAGGSYGGLGGAVEGTPNTIYGSLTNPAALGSGGSCGYYSYVGGDGGGWILIQANEILVDGGISANGGTGTGYEAGSGSGGTINLTASTLSGTGTIKADGGAGEVGGSGGRIAISYLSSTFPQSQIEVLGGRGNSRIGGNGTLFLRTSGQTNGTLTIDGFGWVTPDSSTPIPVGYTFDNVILRNSARVVVDGQLKLNGTVGVQSGSVLTHSLGSEAGLVIEAQRVEVDATSSIDVSSKGYRGGYRDGNSWCEGVTLGGIAGAVYRSGGSYGGYGGVLEGVGSNLPYGSVYDPVYLGSGGSCGYYSYAGGHGGGFVHIKATQALVVDGNLLANGGSGSGYLAGSGSGGSIKIETSLLQGTGAIASNGGAHEVGGGGGRITITYDYLDSGVDDLSGLRNITALGGHGNSRWGSAGTVLMRRSDQQHGDLYVDDGVTDATSSVYTPLTPIGFGTVAAVTEDTLETDGTMNLPLNGLLGLELNPNLNQTVTYRVLTNTESVITVDTSGKPLLTEVTAAGAGYVGIYRFDNVYFRRGGFLVLGDRMIVTDTLDIDEYGRLTHYDATMDFTSMLDLTVGRLEITATGSVNVDERGYLGGNRNGNDCSGQTEGNLNGSTYRSGGSYGGMGGGIEGTPNPIYGNLTNPAALGSGGSCGYYSYAGGDGGGWILIQANEILIDGSISANGGTGTGYEAGSGSGGTITLTISTLSGTGAIKANGGAGEVGGSGGRIAVRFDSLLLDQDKITSSGGHGNHRTGQDGTIYLESNP